MPRKYETKIIKSCRCCYKWRCRCPIPRRGKPHPPFNSGARSDYRLGLHPKLRAFGSTSPAVGIYDPRPADRKLKIISWRKEEETKEFSATVYSKLPKGIVAQKDLMVTGRGPGTHEIPRWPDSVLQAPCEGLRRDVDFGTVPRFVSSYKSTTPGPGYTLRVHNPYYYLDRKRLSGISQVPSFEFDGLVPRFQESRRDWSLPCNRYNVKHPSSLQAFIDKVTGKRGPYDLFTGPRDDTTIKGHWAHAKLEFYGDWPRELPNEMDKFWNRSNYFKGKWSTNPRFTKKPVTRMMLQDISTCYKDPDEPGPGHYDPRAPRMPITLIRYPLDGKVDCARSLPPSDIRPGIGRYKIKHDRSIKGHGWTCVFKSKVPRTIGAVIPPSYRDF